MRMWVWSESGGCSRRRQFLVQTQVASPIFFRRWSNSATGLRIPPRMHKPGSQYPWHHFDYVQKPKARQRFLRRRSCRTAQGIATASRRRLTRWFLSGCSPKRNQFVKRPGSRESKTKLKARNPSRREGAGKEGGGRQHIISRVVP